MALSLSVDKVDETGRELLTYGTDDFPVAFFDDDLVNVIVPFHWHEEFEIVVITDGSVHVRIAGNDFKLKAGEGYFANSGILHSANLESASGHQHALVFSASLISRKGDLIWNSYITPVLANPRIPLSKSRLCLSRIIMILPSRLIRSPAAQVSASVPASGCSAL